MDVDNKTIFWLIRLISIVLACLVGILMLDNIWLKLMLLLVWTWIVLASWLSLKSRAASGQIMSGLLFVFIASTFLNQEFLSIRVGMVTLFVYRLMLAACLLFFLGCLARKQWVARAWRGSPVKAYLLFFVLWGVYGAASLIWAASFSEGLKYLLLLGTGLLFVLLAALTLNQWADLQWFHTIWLVMTALLIGIGLVNYFGQIQLPTSSLYGGPAYKLGYPTAVFTNQNDFATLLSISFFFFLAFACEKRALVWKASGSIGAVLSFFLIVLTESRASEFGVVAGSAFYLFLMVPARWRRRVLAAAGILLVAGVILFSGSIFSKMTPYMTVETHYSINDVPASNIVRIHLLESTMHYLADSFGAGTGAGNLSFALSTRPVFNTNHIFEAHNWLAEIAGTFGIFIGMGYLIIYLALFYSLYRYACPLPKQTKGMLLKGALCGQIAFLISSISPSSVSNLYFHWIFLGFLVTLLAVLRKEAASSYCSGGM